MVQIWDHSDLNPEFNTRIPGHGKIGYIVKCIPTTKDDIFEVICFGEESDFQKYHIHSTWLRKVETKDDILSLDKK